MCRKLLFVFIVLVLGLVSNTWAQPIPVASQDVGGPGLAGSFSYDAGTDSWTVIGSGADIWGSWDSFHYVFRPLSGDGQASCQVVSMGNTSGWAKVGVMIRETLDGNSKHAMVSMTGSNGVQAVYRLETGGESFEVRNAGLAPPYWVRITRTGNTFTFEQSPMGAAFWLPMGMQDVEMNTDVYIGMFVCATNNGALNTTIFDNVGLVAPPVLPAWNISPADGTVIGTEGTTISWVAGDTAASHDVYFGTTDPPPLAGNQTGTSFDTGPLESGTTYYYQIDEVEADGTTVHAGQVRSLKTIREGTGSILYEVWDNIGGGAVTDLTNNPLFPDNPTSSSELSLFETPTNRADNFGGRVHGYLHPETSGDYTFWIATDDLSELWLSTSDSEADAQLIATESAWTNPRDWKDGEQMSAPVALEGGNKYYISAIYKEGGGGDNCAVAWQGPDNPDRDVIAGYYLSPYVNMAPSQPSPVNGDVTVNVDAILSWSAAPTAASYDVYINGALAANVSDAVLTDVTGPGDAVLGVPNDGLMDGDQWGWPGAETPDLAIDDNTGTKFLHFRGDLMSTGIQVTPAVGATVVSGITLTTANDEPGRDPISYELSGSNVSIDGPYEVIAAGDIVDFAQADAWPRFAKNETPILFDNAVAYEHYQIVFPAIRGPVGGGVNSMQIAEIELLGPKLSTSLDPDLDYGTDYTWSVDSVEADGTTKYSSNEWTFSTLARGPGQIKYEMWYNIGGTAVGDLTNDGRYPDSPDTVGFISSMETPTDVADNYGTRISGWLHVPATGDYTFWTSSDDASDLMLSSDEDPANTVRIAYEDSWSAVRDWQTGNEMSDPIPMEKGQIRYIEALMKEGGGGDNLAVAWEGPGIPFQILSGSDVGATPSRPLAAYGFSPGDGATGVALSPTLSWLPGEAAASYDVYFNGESVGNTTETGYETGELVLGESYTWQVDTIDGEGGVTAGPLLSFTVSDNIVIDDFEAYAVAPVNPGSAGLWGYYPLNGDVLDHSSNGHDGTLVGEPAVIDGPAGYGAALEFSAPGGDDYVDLGTLNPSEETGQLSVSLWLKWNGISGEWQGLIGKRDNWAADDMMWHLECNADSGDLGANRHSGQAVGGYGTPEVGVWEHCAFSFDGTTGTLYRDGVYAGSGAFSLGPDTEAALLFGANNGGGWNPFNGALDEVRIYDRALSEPEVMHLAGLGPAGPVLDETWSEAGLVDASGGYGTMDVETYSWPGLPYYLGEVGRVVPFADLTTGGAKSLSIWFRGDPGNVVQYMYAILSDGDGNTGISVYGEPDDLASSDWREWNIDLRDFAGVDETNATTLAIGLAGLDGGATSDLMVFDDIRVYTGRCMPDIIKPLADLNNDCVVNIEDAQIIASEWGTTTTTYSVIGDGADIWAQADQFHYAYQEMTGDGEISARVVGISPASDGWSKAGVMIRETLDADSKHMMMVLTSGEGSGIAFQGRMETAGASTSFHGDISASPPHWVKLTRVGNTITAYHSADGTNWELFTDASPDGAHTNPIEVAMAETVNIGLSITSHNTAGELRTGTFDNVTINGVLSPELADADIGDTTPGSSSTEFTYSIADLNQDGEVRFEDFFIMLDEWLVEMLWPY